MAARLFSRCEGALVALVCVLGLTSAATYAEPPAVVFEITAEAADGASSTIPILAEWGDYDPVTRTWAWDMPADLIFYHGTTTIAYLTDFNVQIADDPEVNLTFSVQAGQLETTFRVASSLIDNFPTIANPEGRASAGYTVTDFNGNGATLTGIGETGGGYLAKYNGYAGDIPPGGTTFTEGLSLISAGVFQSTTQSFEDPVGGGFRSIGDPVSSLSSLAYFRLTARDLASGTSNFQIVPEPGALALLAIGGLTLLLRRSR